MYINDNVSFNKDTYQQINNKNQSFTRFSHSLEHHMTVKSNYFSSVFLSEEIDRRDTEGSVWANSGPTGKCSPSAWK